MRPPRKSLSSQPDDDASVEELADVRRATPRLSLPGTLIRNALALMVSSGGTAILGVGFWAIAARLTDPRRIGLASAELTAVSLVATLADVGFGSILLRFLPTAGDRTRDVVLRSYVASTVLGTALAVGYVLLGFGDRFLPAGIVWKLVFIATTTCWTVFVLQDQALTGLRATKWVPVENIIFSAVKIALLPAFLALTAQQGIFLSWSLPVVGAIVGVNLYLFHKRIPEHRAEEMGETYLPTGKALFSFVAARYATSLVGTFAVSVIPLFILYRLGAVANGHFYLPWASSLAFSRLIWSLTSSFVVEAAYDSSKLRQHVDRTVRFGVLVLLPAVALGVALAPVLLSAFGKSYSADGTTLLRLLLLSAPGTMLTAFYTSFAWLEQRVWWLAIQQTISAGVTLFGSVLLLGHFGIVGVGIAALATEAVQAVLMLPGAVNRYKRARSPEGMSFEREPRT